MNQYIYGPVPSRRLGLSLGIDLVTDNVCSYDCIYCQLGRTREKTVLQKQYVSINVILEQLFHKLDSGVNPDFITMAGSGEPTLNSRIGELIRRIKQETGIPVAVVTNSSMLSEVHVKESLMDADVVLPSLGAYNQTLFEIINRPHSSIKFDIMLEGIKSFVRDYSGDVWLEVFVLKGINDKEADALKYKSLIEEIHPQQVDVNTAIRPSAEPSAQKVSAEVLNGFCRILGNNAQMIAPFEKKKNYIGPKNIKIQTDIISILSRRPCTLNDISSGLDVSETEVIKYVELLILEKKIQKLTKGSLIYYRI